MTDHLDASAAAVHTALDGYLADGEIAVAWVLTIDVAGPDGSRYLAHRAGGGHDGNDMPMAWSVVGMLQASLDGARDQLRENTYEPDDEEGDEP